MTSIIGKNPCRERHSKGIYAFATGGNCTDRADCIGGRIFFMNIQGESKPNDDSPEKTSGQIVGARRSVPGFTACML